jgi:hypothetical protein
METCTKYRYGVQGAGPELLPRFRWSVRGLRRLVLGIWEAPWPGVASSSHERLPDPAKHPECWFRVI